MELANVHPGGDAGVYANLVPVDDESVSAEGASESMEGPAQGSTAPGVIVLGPEQVDQGISALALARDGKVGYKGDGLAPVEPDRLAVALDTRWTQQIERQAGTHGPSFLTSLLESR